MSFWRTSLVFLTLLAVTALTTGCKPTSRVAIYEKFELFANDGRHYTELIFSGSTGERGRPLYIMWLRETDIGFGVEGRGYRSPRGKR